MAVVETRNVAYSGELQHPGSDAKEQHVAADPSASDLGSRLHTSAEALEPELGDSEHRTKSGAREASTSSGDSDDSTEGGDGSRKGFLEGGKGASFSKAFAKILGRQSEVDGSSQILKDNRVASKRAAQDDAATHTDKDAKKRRLEMRQRGHKRVPCKGEDPAADAAEKALQQVATRGVVQLFNAVARAQKEAKEAFLNGGKGKTGLTKAAFFQQLKQGSVPAKTGKKDQQSGKGDKDGKADAGKGWDVLKEGFTGLKSKHKLKDWDKKESSGEGEEEGEDAELSGSVEDDW